MRGEETEKSQCQLLMADSIQNMNTKDAIKGYMMGYVDMVDKDSPESACRQQLCRGDYAQCDPLNREISPALRDMVLVFSDEFEKEGRRFDVKARDPRWTAEDIYYFPTQDIEVYKPEQIETYSTCFIHQRCI